MSPFSPLGFGGTLCIFAAYLSLMMNLDWSNPGLWMGTLGLLVGIALRGRWNFDRRVAAVLVLVPLAMAWLLPAKMAVHTRYLSTGTFRLAVGLVTYAGTLLCWRYRQLDQRVALVLAVVAQLVALVSMERAGTAWPVLVQVIGLALAMREERLGRPFWRDELRTMVLRSLMPLGLTATISVGGVLAFQWSDTKVNFLMSLINSAPAGSLRFPEKASLTGLWHGSGNPAIVARYYSDRPSLYLVSRCYRQYMNGSWELAQQGANELTSGSKVEDRYRYQLQEAAPTKGGAVERVEVTEPSPGLLFPRDSIYCVSNAPNLRRTFGACLAYPQGTSEDPFDFVRADHEPTEFGSDSRAQLLESTPSSKYQLRQISLEWVPETEALQLTPEQLAHRWENYLQNHYDYGFDFKAEEHQDPVLIFLKKKPASHCELFGSALALMCRAHDIPTRYVNGFLAKEWNDSGGYTVIRVKHAHAWVEAYFEGKGWVTLDGTPSVARQFPVDWTSRFQHFTDLIHTFLAKLASQDWQTAFQLGKRLVKPFFLPLFVVWLLYQFWVRRYRKTAPRKSPIRVSTSSGPRHPSEAEVCCISWSGVGSKLASHDLSVRLYSVGRNEVGPVTAEFLQNYGYLRYGCSTITAEQFAQLQQQLESALREAAQAVQAQQPQAR